MIPDKIYVGIGTLSSIQPAEEYAFPGWQEKPYSEIRNEEYIRKDALLEWAKEQFEYYKQIDDDFDGDVFIGNRHAFAEMISKINSL